MICENIRPAPMPRPVKYEGHGREAGLQQHSVGDLYPFTVVGTSRGLSPTLWRWQNLKTGQTGNWKRTQQEALIELCSIRVYSLMNS